MCVCVDVCVCICILYKISALLFFYHPIRMYESQEIELFAAISKDPGGFVPGRGGSFWVKLEKNRYVHQS